MNKKEKIKARGKIRFEELITESGGTYSIDKVAEILSITKDEVLQYYNNRKLLAFEYRGELVYPTWQFNNGDVIPYFGEIMSILGIHPPVCLFRFFLTYDSDLKLTPVEAMIKGDPKEIHIVRILAQQFNNQVAR